MTKDEVVQLIQEEISRTEGFRKWRKMDSVTDQFSPITGASSQIGFYGKSKIAQQTVTGAKGGNAALTSLLTKLANLGLIVDSSS